MMFWDKCEGVFFKKAKEFLVKFNMGIKIMSLAVVLQTFEKTQPRRMNVWTYDFQYNSNSLKNRCQYRCRRMKKNGGPRI